MAYQETLPRRDFRRYRKVINTASIGSQLLGGLDDGWVSGMQFWVTTIHLALGAGTWSVAPALTLGVNLSDTNLIGTAVSLGTANSAQVVRTPFAAGGLPASLIGIFGTLRCNVTTAGVVTGPGESPLISVDYCGYWMTLVNTVT